MSGPRRRVPIALRLAARLLPPDAREEVLGDLIEAWRDRSRNGPRWSATWWALRQPMAALRARFGPGRAARGAGGTGPGVAEGPADGERRDPGPLLRRARSRRPGPVFSWLDLKLGFRMLGRQPILTVVAGATLALGIPASLMPAHIVGAFDEPFPVDEGDRIFGLRNWNVDTGRQDMRPLHDLAVWREELTSFSVIGAARSDPWNVHSPDGRAAEIRGAEVTPSVFDMLRVPPLMGRTLVAGDQVEGAPDVVVISEDVWASRFARDPEIVGRTIGIGRRPHTVVGVMPSGFLFPSMDHLWLPLRADPTDYAVGAGPDLLVFGRLVDGVGRRQAAAELETVGARLALEWPDTHQHYQPEVVPVTYVAFGQTSGGMRAEREVLYIQLFGLALLAVVCGNVGILILARTATRVSEIAVRTALGASRARILSQLFAEALVLSVGATAVGLVAAEHVADLIARTMLDGELPYGMDIGLRPESIVLALALAAVCAVGAGVLPAIKATSPRIQESLQRNAAGTTVRFGPFTTLLVVSEVALSFGFLSLGTAAMLSFMQDRTDQAAMQVDRYLVASLRTPWIDPTEAEEEGYLERFRVRIAENHVGLRDRLAADGSVRHVAMGQHVAGVSHPDRPIVLVGDDGTAGSFRTMVGSGRVHFDHFADLEIPVLHGRAFSAADVEGEPDAHRPSVVVNQQFVDEVLGGGQAVGRRVAYALAGDRQPEDWYEIVGVVETFGTNVENPERSAALYHPLSASDINPMRFVVEVAGETPSSFIPRLRQIAAEVDPDAMIQNAVPLTDVIAASRLADRIITLFVFTLSTLGIVLAATGLYALMSFTVAQRTREIGIRTALGAGARNVVTMIARRAILQLVVGIGFGSILGWWVVGQVADQSEFSVDSVPLLLAGVAVAVMTFAGLACLAPTMRGLKIQPTEALRDT